MGYIVCKRCGGHYQLQEGESPEDFESCQCGGQLEYVDALTDLKEDNDLNNSNDQYTCPNCGSPISEYSIICRNCGFKLGQEEHEIDEDTVSSDSVLDNNDETQDLENEVDETELGKGIHDSDLEELTPQKIDIAETDIISEDLIEENTICPKCKKENDSQSNFCKFCGYDLKDKPNQEKNFIDKSDENTHPSKPTTCPTCGAEVQEYSIICRSCGKPLKTESSEIKSQTKKESTDVIKDNSEDKTLSLELIINDFVYILTSMSFIKSLLLLGFAIAFAGNILGGFFTSIVFLFCAMVFSIISKKNTRISLEGGFILATIGIIIILILHSSWILSIIDLCLFIFTSLFGAFLGRQLVKRGLVK